MLALFRSSFLLLLCLLAAACSTGPQPIKVKGNVTYNGKPYQIDPKGSVNLTFIPVDVADNAAYDKPTARMNKEDSTFIINHRGVGMTPGKYRVAVMQMVPEPSQEILDMNAKFTAKDSPIVIEITGEGPYTIDLAKD